MAYCLFFGLCSLYPFPLIHSHVDKQSIGFLCVQYNSTLHRKWNFLCIRKQYLYHAIMEKGFDKRICSRKIILSNDELERQTTAVQCSESLWISKPLHQYRKLIDIIKFYRIIEHLKPLIKKYFISTKSLFDFAFINQINTWMIMKWMDQLTYSWVNFVWNHIGRHLRHMH